jgi:hypothetical protein
VAKEKTEFATFPINVAKENFNLAGALPDGHIQ